MLFKNTNAGLCQFHFCRQGQVKLHHLAYLAIEFNLQKYAFFLNLHIFLGQLLKGGVI